MREITGAGLLHLHPAARIACHMVGRPWVASLTAAERYASEIAWLSVNGTPEDDDTHVVVTVDGTEFAVAKKATLVVREPEPQVPLDALTVRILRDVHGGQVEMLPHEVYLIPADVLPPDGEDYRVRVLSMRIYNWIMPVDGDDALRLTSIGEHYWRASNPERYESPTAFEVRDGQYRSTAVTA